MLSVDKNSSQGGQGTVSSYNTVNRIEQDWLGCFFCWQEHYFSVSYLYINTCTSWHYSIPLYKWYNLHEDPDLFYKNLAISLNAESLEMKIFLGTHFYLSIICTVYVLIHYWKMETFSSHKVFRLTSNWMKKENRKHGS